MRILVLITFLFSLSVFSVSPRRSYSKYSTSKKSTKRVLGRVLGAKKTYRSYRRYPRRYSSYSRYPRYSRYSSNYLRYERDLERRRRVRSRARYFCPTRNRYVYGSGLNVRVGYFLD